jgi:hypothetical protein
MSKEILRPQGKPAPVQEPVETYIHEYRSHPHPNDFGIPKGHWWRAKQYADALAQPAQQEPIDLVRAIEYADARWSGVDVPIEWARHFAEGIRRTESAHGIKETTK